MAPPLPADFRLQPAVGTVRDGAHLEGGTPRVRVELAPSVVSTVASLLAGEPLGSVDAPDAEAAARRLLQLDLATPHPDPGPRNLRVAAVVPAKDAASTLPAALDALTGVDEVIVVDDGSTDGTAQIASARGATVIRRQIAGGPASARNDGAAQTEADVVVFLDADAEAPAGWVGELLRHFDDPAVGAVAPRVRSIGDGSLVARYDAASGALDRGAAPGWVRPDGRITFVSTTALAVRRTAFDTVGGFAADLRFGEDLDLVWRLWEAGHPVVYEPSVVVGHHHRPDLASHLRNQFRYATASGPLSSRHGGVPRAGRAEPAIALGAVAFVIGSRRLGAALALAGTARHAQRLLEERVPPGHAALDAVRSTLEGGRNIAAAVSRPWLFIAFAVAGARPRARPGVVSAIGARWVLRSRRADADGGRAGWIVMRALEDAAHSAGVMAGCVSAGRFSPLLPARPAAPARSRSVLGEELHLA